MSKKIFSGVQPTGNLHLGNYLGAIKNWVGLQKDHETIYCIVDLHAITVPQEPKSLSTATHEVAACLIASGIDVNNSILFNQSQVPQHAELAWLFNCVARLGWLNRMTQFKEKAGKNRENATVGLYAYPTLMAADILAYKATYVPVGEDQKQHLELTRDIAIAFNSMFGEKFFPIPDPIIQKTAARIMSLRDGTSKMSKSSASDFTRINLNDDDDLIAQKIKKATKKEISSMLHFCLTNLENKNFFKQNAKKPIMLENLRNIFYRMELSDKETRILSSVFASLGKKR